MVERFGLPAEPLARWERGEVLYDMTKAVLAV
jgi:hypothetical protein